VTQILTQSSPLFDHLVAFVAALQVLLVAVVAFATQNHPVALVDQTGSATAVVQGLAAGLVFVVARPLIEFYHFNAYATNVLKTNKKDLPKAGLFYLAEEER
jgi:hypothetical protein